MNKKRRWNQIGQEDTDAELLSPFSRESRQSVAGGDGEDERDEHNEDTHEGSVEKPLAVLGF